MGTALVIIDMLNDFRDGVLANPAADGIVQPIARLAEAARATGDGLVVYANDAHQPDDLELRVFPPHAMAGTAGAEVVPELAPRPGDLVVPKRFYSAFTETDLDAQLRARDLRRLVLVGQHTDCCVRHTAYDAFRLGYELWVGPAATTVFASGDGDPLEVRQARALAYLVTYYGARLEGIEEALSARAAIVRDDPQATGLTASRGRTAVRPAARARYSATSSSRTRRKSS